MIATRSDWDSEVFGYEVGILHAKAPVFAYDVKMANLGRFDVVFVKVDGWVDPYGTVEALDHLYDMELMTGETPSSVHVSRIVSTVRHLEIAKRAFQDSRFLRDHRLHERVPEMYTRWMIRKEVMVLDGSEDSAFLLQSEDPDGAHRISLVAVDERNRSYGFGKLLVTAVTKLFPSSTWRVKVSCQNFRAIRFYETVGFRVKEAKTVFHVWI